MERPARGPARGAPGVPAAPAAGGRARRPASGIAPAPGERPPFSAPGARRAASPPAEGPRTERLARSSGRSRPAARADGGPAAPVAGRAGPSARPGVISGRVESVPKNLGFSYRRLPSGRVVVDRVTRGSWAEKLGVQVGDRFATVGGERPDEMSTEELLAAVKARPQEVVFHPDEQGDLVVIKDSVSVFELVGSPKVVRVLKRGDILRAIGPAEQYKDCTLQRIAPSGAVESQFLCPADDAKATSSSAELLPSTSPARKRRGVQADPARRPASKGRPGSSKGAAGGSPADSAEERRLLLDTALAMAQRLREERRASLWVREPSLEGAIACEDEDRWCFEKWLTGSVAPVVAEALRAPLTGSSDAEFSFARALGFMEQDHPGQVKQIVQDLLQQGGVLEKLAASVVASAGKLTGTKATTSSELNLKFASSEETFELNFGEVEDFFSGLEDLVGSPNPKVRTAMASEHCNQSDSRIEWTTGNYKITTTAETEWHFVVDPTGEWKPNGGTWPAEGVPTDHPRQAKPLSELKSTFEDINQKLKHQQPLSEEEWVGARLYTGPMFEKYNAVNRGGAKGSSARQRQNEVSRERFAKLCLDNRYCTTIHVINSALIKLSKLEPAGKVYRGISRGVLPPCFLHRNEAGVRGGVEFGFLSTSKKREVALDYAKTSEASTVLEIGTGMIDRGANLAPISQYPYEEEICFPPLACMEVVRSRVEGSVLVVEVRLNVNFTAPTIERVIAKRLGLIESMCDNLRLETRHNLSNPLWQNVKNKDEVAGAKVLELVGEMAAADLKSVTAAAKDQPELFNDDVTLLAAMKTALGISDSVKWQASRVLRRAAAELKSQGGADVDMIAHIMDIANEHEKVEWKEMDPIDVKREQTMDLGLGPGSSPGHFLDLLKLMQRDGVIEVAEPCKLWPNVQPHSQLVTVDGTSTAGEPAVLAKLLINERPVPVVFLRPLEPKELMASLLQMLKNAEGGSTEEAPLLVGRCLALNRSLRTVNLFNHEGIGPRACAALARAVEDNRTIDSLFFGLNEPQEDTALALERALGANQTLGTLYVEKGSFGARGGEAIANGLKINGTLHTLRIRSAQLGEAGGCFVAKALCTNKSLSVLYIEKNDLGPEGANGFGAALKCNRTLGQLHMDTTNLGPAGGEAIAGALRSNEKIHSLFVKQNNFGEPGGRAFGAMLSVNKTLRTLGIDKNGLGLSGVAIARALAKDNRTLQSLSIESNGLGEEFAEAIAEVIRENREFQTLSMGDNQIGRRGGEILARELEANSTMLRLEVQRNNLCAQGALAFARMLKNNHGLNRLDISENQLTEETGNAFAETFLTNTAFRRLKISESEVGERAANSLRETFKGRKLELA